MRTDEEMIAPVFEFAWRFDEPALCPFPRRPLYGLLLLHTLTSARQPTGNASGADLCSKEKHARKLRSTPCQRCAAIAMRCTEWRARKGDPCRLRGQRGMDGRTKVDSPRQNARDQRVDLALATLELEGLELR